MLIGYARVSTQDQNLELQIEALTKPGCKKIFEDKISGSRSERPGHQHQEGWRLHLSGTRSRWMLLKKLEHQANVR